MFPQCDFVNKPHTHTHTHTYTHTHTSNLVINVMSYARNCHVGSRSDGFSTVELVKTFRQRFKLNVRLAAAVGTGQILMAAGQPHGNEAV